MPGSSDRRGRRAAGGRCRVGIAAALVLAAQLAPTLAPAEEGAPDPSRSAGCGHPPPRTGTFTSQTTDGRGTERSFRLTVAHPYDPDRPLALTIVFHGGGGDEFGAMRFGLQDVPGAAADSIFAFPRGLPFEHHGVGWNEACDGYDMPFFDNMVAAIEAQYCIDPARIFVAGFSWGCDFVTALACCRGDRIGAVAAAACSDDFGDPADVRSYVNPVCPVPSRAAVRFTHAAGADSLYPAPLFATTGALFAKLNRCTGPRPEPAPGSCVAYPGCRAGVVECAVPGIDHAVGPHWAEDTWAFFSRIGRKR